jgi:CRISPR-associated protein (TIGR02584 family)
MGDAMINSDPNKKHILVAIAGNTTQIVTETLYALMIQHKPSVPISDVYLMTTTHGKEIAWNTLGGEGGAIARFYQSYKLGPIAFTKNKHILVFKNADGSLMQDVRTTEDNRVLQSQMLGHIQRFTSDPKLVLHCLVGGGRRTMTANMMLALTVFGREQDSLTHVLVDEEFETNPTFFFPPKEKKIIGVFRNGKLDVADASKAKIDLAEIPIARLRDLYGRKINNLKTDINKLLDIAQTQIEISQSMPEQLIIDLRNGTASWGNEEINLGGFNLALFIYYALRKAQHCEEEWRTECGDCYECYRMPLDLDIDGFLDTYKIVQPKSGNKETEYRSKFSEGKLNLLPSHSNIKREAKKFSDSLEVINKERNSQAVYGLKIDKTRIHVINPKSK